MKNIRKTKEISKKVLKTTLRKNILEKQKTIIKKNMKKVQEKSRNF